MQRSFGGRISDIRPRGSLKSRDRPALFWVGADFFGFFGALKKGDFFWVHPKKVGGGQRVRAERCKKALPTGCPKSFIPRPLRERGPGGGGCRGRTLGGPAEKRGEFFGVRPKKLPPRRPGHCIRPNGGRTGQKVPVIAVERRQNSVDLAQLLFFFHSLFFSPKGSRLCDTKRG
jgi:hypothetical protein